MIKIAEGQLWSFSRYKSRKSSVPFPSKLVRLSFPPQQFPDKMGLGNLVRASMIYGGAQWYFDLR